MRFVIITLVMICSLLFVGWQITEVFTLKQELQEKLEHTPQQLSVVTHYVKYVDPPVSDEFSVHWLNHFADQENKSPDVLLYMGCVEVKTTQHPRYNLPGKIKEHYGKQCEKFMKSLDVHLFQQPKFL